MTSIMFLKGRSVGEQKKKKQGQEGHAQLKPRSTVPVLSADWPGLPIGNGRAPHKFKLADAPCKICTPGLRFLNSISVRYGVHC